MRFGMLAGAIALLWAGQASGTTWLKYTFTGEGTRYYQNINSDPQPIVSNISFTASLFVQVDPEDGSFTSPYSQGFYSTAGNSFGSYDFWGGDISTVVRTGDKLQIDLSRNNAATRVAVRSNLRVNLPSGFDAGLPRMLGSYSLSGMATLDNSVHYTGDEIYGVVSGLTISKATDYAPFLFESTPVPELATWTMLILGFGVIGGVVRRQKSHGRTSVSFA